MVNGSRVSRKPTKRRGTVKKRIRMQNNEEGEREEEESVKK